MTEDRRTLIMDADLSGALAGVRQLDKTIDRTETNAGKVADKLDHATASTGKLGAAQAQLHKAIGAAQGGLGGLANMAAGLPGPFMALAAAAGLAAAAVKLVGEETARLDEKAKSAQKSGFAVESYQRLEHVAKLSGTEIGNLTKGVGFLNVELDKIGRGATTGPVVEALDELKLSAEELRAAKPEDQLKLIAGAMEAIPSEADRSRLAFKLMSEDGKQLVPIFNAGAAAIDDMSDSAGRIFTAGEIDKASAYEDSLTKLESTIAGVKGEIAIGLAPMLTEITDEMNAGAKGASGGLAPAFKLAFNRIEAGIRPVIEYIAFFARGLAFAAEVIEDLGYYGENALNAIGDAGGEVQAWLADTPVGKWAIDAKDSIVSFAGDGIDRLTTAINEHIPWAKDLGAAWETVRDAIEEADEVGEGWVTAALKQADDHLEDRRRQTEAANAVEGDRVKLMEAAVVQADHMLARAQAQGLSARELEGLYQDQHMARVDLYQTTKDIASLEKQMRDEEVRQLAVMSKRRGGGGARSSQAELLKAAGEEIVAGWTGQLDIMEAEAALIFEGAVEFGDHRRAIAVEALELERQTLAVTKTKTEAERINLEARQAAIGRELVLLDLGRQRDEQAQAEDFARVAAEERIAALDREIERNDALGVSVALLQEHRDTAALDYAERFAGDEAVRDEQHAQELARIEESKASWQSWADLRAKQYAEEIKRLDDQAKRQAATVSRIGGYIGQGQAVATAVTDMAIKDDARREKAALRLQGVMAMAKGAMAVVNAVTSFASFNFVQGALHTAAAAVAFTQGGMMLAGKIPGGGSASAGAGGAAGGGAAPSFAEAPAQQQNTPKTPVSAEELTRVRGGMTAGSESTQQNASGPTINIYGSTVIGSDAGTTLATLDDEQRKRYGT